MMLTSVGLFAGIGGFEEGLRRSGIRSELLCELDPAASEVLKRRFGEARVDGDIHGLRSIPRVDLVAAGFPCQDLSQAGRTTGINGRDSSLVNELFRLISKRGNTPRWVLLENVPFMLHLNRGGAMRYVTHHLEELGFTWAYRVVDTRAFGLPQRRKRVFVLASKTEDPRGVLLASNEPERSIDQDLVDAFGFYWTEGNRGLGWAVDSIPALKIGSRISIPSSPAIWIRSKRQIVLPDISDAERLQGFRAGWTKPPVVAGVASDRDRWRLVGNAVSVPVAKWIGDRIRTPKENDSSYDVAVSKYDRWGNAGWGRKGERYNTTLSDWPVSRRYKSLIEFLNHPVRPLSAKASAGFLRRASASSLRINEEFLADVAHHLRYMKGR